MISNVGHKKRESSPAKANSPNATMRQGHTVFHMAHAMWVMIMHICEKHKDKAFIRKRKEQAKKAKIKHKMKKKIEEENRAAAREFIRKHNVANPDDRYLLHGSYSRTIHVWCEELGCMLDLKVKITRIRSKAQKRTFSFQGGYFIFRARYGGKFLLGTLARLAQRSGKTFEDICYLVDLPPGSARLYHRRLKDFLKKIGNVDFLMSAAPENIPDLFIGQLWYTQGNPFCSAMEAAR